MIKKKKSLLSIAFLIYLVCKNEWSLFEMELLEEALLEGKDIRAIESISKPDVGRNKRNRSWYCAVDI